MASNNEDHKPPTASTPPKTLSRASLYVSLAAYNQSNVDPATYMRQRTSTRKSVQETSLIDFLQLTSRHYHRQTATRFLPKNTASRPLSRQEVSDRIRQRTLSLVGGAYHDGVGKKRSSTPSERPRKKRRLSREREHRGKSTFVPEVPDGQATFLRDLNLMWNDYARQLLQQHGCIFDGRDGNNIQAYMRAFGGSIEWVGARVRVEECKQHQEWRGRDGILVEETKRIWRVMRDHKGTTVEGTSSQQSKRTTIQTLLVPKGGSLLTVLLPIEDDDQTLTEPNDAPHPTDSHTRRHLCIRLHENEQESR